MAQGEQTKAERRAARGTKAERKQARSGEGAKAERKRGRGGRKRAEAGAAAVPEAPTEDATSEERIEWRLARIEEAVAAQSERSEELLARVNELLQEAPSSEA